MREEALNRDKAKLAKVARWNCCILFTLTGITAAVIMLADSDRARGYGFDAAVDMSKQLGCYSPHLRKSILCDWHLTACDVNMCEMKTENSYADAFDSHVGEIIEIAMAPALIAIIAVQGAVNAAWIIPTLCRYTCLRCCGKVALNPPSDSLLGENEFASDAVVEVEDSKGCWARLIGRSRRDNEVPLLVTGEGMDGIVEDEEASKKMCVIL